jgi:hypothetical protein
MTSGSCRLVEGGGGERHALLPAAGEFACELLAALVKTQAVERVLDPLLPTVEAVDAGHEHQIFFDREIVVERELLRHVADAQLYLVGLFDDVEAKAFARA